MLQPNSLFDGVDIPFDFIPTTVAVITREDIDLTIYVYRARNMDDLEMIAKIVNNISLPTYKRPNVSSN